MAIKKLVRWALIGGGVVVVLVIVVVAGVVIKRNTIVRVGVQDALSQVLGVKVTVGGADVSLLGGSVTLKNLKVGNPSGYKTAEAFAFKRAQVRVDLKSFATGQPEIALVSIDGPQVTLEKGLKQSNLGQLIENASRFGGGGSGSAKPAGGEKTSGGAKPASQTQIKIDEVQVANATVGLSAPILQGKEASFPLPTLTLHDLGGQGKRVSIAESLRIFFTRILEAAVSAGGNVMPAALRKDFQQSLDTAKAQVENLGGEIEKQGGALGKTLGGEIGGLGGQLKKATEGLTGKRP